MLKGGSVPIKLVVIFFLLAVKHLVEKKTFDQYIFVDSRYSYGAWIIFELEYLTTFNEIVDFHCWVTWRNGG